MTSVAPQHTLPPAAPVIIEPDAHGQAALLLIESLLHALVENATLTTTEVEEVLTTAAEVKVEVAEAAGESKGRMQESLMLLAKIAGSFEADRL